MKRILILGALICFFNLTLSAQIQTPAASPSSTLEQTVGLTDIEVSYSRPSMKGREIFGDLVPYGRIWRTGANATTKFTTDKPVTIGGKTLEAGTYSIYTVPQEEQWEVIFYTDHSQPILNEFDDSKIALRTMAEVDPMPMPIETFTITIDDVTPNGAVLGMLWEEAYVGVPFKVDTDTEVMESIETALNGPSAQEYYAAAVYYLNADKDINKAKDYMNKAMSMIDEPGFWQLRQQSLILAKAGDRKQAIEVAKKSLEGAQKAGNQDYIKMNKDSLKEWGATQ